MKTLLKSLAFVALGAVMFYAIGTTVAGAHGPAKGDPPCPNCPLAAADNSAAPPMMEKMKAHFEGMKNAVAALRESEKKLEGTEDPKAFRAAVIDHLKKLDDLQASHLSHMEQMMERMHGGMPGMGRCDCPDCRCRDCGCRHGGDCCCGCGCRGGGHVH